MKAMLVGVADEVAQLWAGWLAYCIHHPGVVVTVRQPVQRCVILSATQTKAMYADKFSKLESQIINIRIIYPKVAHLLIL